MTVISNSAIVAQGVELCRSVLSLGNNDVDNHQTLQDWLAFEQTIARAVRSGLLDTTTTAAVSAIAFNVRDSISTLLSLRKDMDNELNHLTDEVMKVAITEPTRCKRRSCGDDSDRYRSSKRNCRPTTTKYLPTPSPPPSTKSLKPPPTTAPDPVRQYFLTHLASPYPTPSEKEKLCKKAKITRRKLESDLTNWRRRSDWTDIMNTYCGGDKSAMRIMVGAIERGEERDEELLERFGRMKAYLEKRDEQAGEWVHKLAEMVKSGRLDEMRFQQIDDDSDADANSNSESEREEEEEDAEGESEDGNEYRNHPVPVPVPVTPLKEIPRYGKEVLGPYTTVPLDMTIPIPIPNVKPESPLTDLSPSSAGSHVPSIPSNNSYFNAKVQHPPPINYIHQQQASAKSSYSSLSAASSMVGPRKRNISDSSTSSNLRSTSGSSTSSFPEKRQGRESFSRSRSRVEEVLSDNSTTSPWVDGHAPNQGFHIGYDPRFRTHPQTQPQYQERPPPYEIGPYVMAPSGWSTYDTMPMSMPMPMPHMTSGGKGGFTIPREYEFTFEHAHAHGHGQGHGYGGAQGQPRAQ